MLFWSDYATHLCPDPDTELTQSDAANQSILYYYKHSATLLLLLCNMLLLVLTEMYFVCGLGKWKEMKGDDVVITNIYIFVETFLVSCVVFPLCFYVVCVLIIQQIQLSSWLKISFHRSSIEKG